MLGEGRRPVIPEDRNDYEDLTRQQEPGPVALVERVDPPGDGGTRRATS